MEEVDQLIEALNPRGHRESSLKEALLQERERLHHVLQNCDRSKYRNTGKTIAVHRGTFMGNRPKPHTKSAQFVNTEE